MLNVIFTSTRVVYKKDKCDVNFYFMLDVVHVSFGAWNSSNDNVVILFIALSWHHGLNTLYQLMFVCVWLYLALSTSVRNNKLIDNRNFQFSMFYGSTLFSNGSWISVWNIKFRIDEQILELKGKLLVSLISCV